MDYPALVLVPIFMLLDYFLTIKGRIQREKEYSQRFQLESYELNPRWQADVAKTRWLNPRHLVAVYIVTMILVVFLEFTGIPRPYAEFILGLLLLIYGAIVGRHLANIAIFRALAKNPQLVSGQITMTQQFALVTSMWQTSAILVPLVTLMAISPSASLAGAVCGAALLLIMHWRWLRRLKKKSAATAPEPE